MTHIPYGTGYLPCAAEANAVLCSQLEQLHSEQSGSELVRKAMEHPLDSPSLAQLAVGKKTATIIISDHTRPVPSREILPCMIEELRQGNPDIKICFLVATGFHRKTTPEELRFKLGAELAASIPIHVHDALDTEQNIEIGTLPSGTPLVIDRLAVQTDLLLAEGFIEPHFFAGFSGGRKSVLPGVCDKATILSNHCGSFISSPFARTGVLENNPVHIDMVAAARMAKLAYIVNVVINDQKRIAAAFAGNFESAHLAGVEFLRTYCQVAPVPGDIVITSNGGAPLDQNIYQCVKGLTAAEATAKAGAVLIMCAQLADGTGGEGFYRSLRDCKTPAALFTQCANTPKESTIPDQWESQILARILTKHHVIFVSRPEMRQILLDMKLDYCSSIDEAIHRAELLLGTPAEITIIPNGISVVVKEA